MSFSNFIITTKNNEIVDVSNSGENLYDSKYAKNDLDYFGFSYEVVVSNIEHYKDKFERVIIDEIKNKFFIDKHKIIISIELNDKNSNFMDKYKQFKNFISFDQLELNKNYKLKLIEFDKCFITISFSCI